MELAVAARVGGVAATEVEVAAAKVGSGMLSTFSGGSGRVATGGGGGGGSSKREANGGGTCRTRAAGVGVEGAQPRAAFFGGADFNSGVFLFANAFVALSSKARNMASICGHRNVGTPAPTGGSAGRRFLELTNDPCVRRDAHA